MNVINTMHRFTFLIIITCLWPVTSLDQNICTRQFPWKKKKGLDKKINDQESFLQSTEKQFLL